MGVIGYVVGDGRDLRFQRGKAPKFQIVAGVVVGNSNGDALVAIASGSRTVASGQGSVVLDDALERFPGQVQAIEFGIAMLQRSDHAQTLRVVVEAAMRLQADVKRSLAGLAEGGRAGFRASASVSVRSSSRPS